MRHKRFLNTVWVVLLLATTPAAAGAAPSRPVVVELFTAQGCAACPDANRLVDALADRKDVIALTYSVDYWDYLGWADTFAKPEFTARQRAYQRKLKLREISTPEWVVGGRDETSGAETDKIDELVKDAAGSLRGGPSVRLLWRGSHVRVDAGRVPAGGADVWLVRYDPAEQDVRIRTGENKGKTVPHRNVVRELERIGGWTGKTRTYAIPAADTKGLKTLVMVQGAKGGLILSAAGD